jgi:murein DD-endopeptidase MepM/ murein hydrolase activator NlpD
VPWPVSGSISSPFGPRVNPIFNTPEFHTGIDIAVDYGTPIRAAAAGQVIYAATMQGYGDVVILDHGGALSTLYAHMSQILVPLGDHVAQGQRIGLVGCTGLCTGPHLHFETRVGGAPVQPLGLLP